MKGVSIALETVVYVILAVTVLTVLLYFFTTVAGPGQSTVELQSQKTQLCGEYIQYDSTCTQLSSAGNIPAASTVASKLIETCGKLKTRKCFGSDKNDQECIQYCCLQCPIRPA